MIRDIIRGVLAWAAFLLFISTASSLYYVAKDPCSPFFKDDDKLHERLAECMAKLESAKENE